MPEPRGLVTETDSTADACTPIGLRLGSRPVNGLNASIEADARQRLRVPPGEHPVPYRKQFSDFLKYEAKRIRLRSQAHTGGREMCRAHAFAVDVALTQFITALVAYHAAKGSPAGPRWALVAVGGYGRGELNPFSDIDVIVLLEGDRVDKSKLPPAVYELTVEGRIWDLGFKVGCMTRTVADCVEQANRDMQSKTALLEARLIYGDEPLFHAMQKAVLTRCVKGHEEDYVEERLKDQQTRRVKHGNTPFMQEPNIKNGCGGLRDFQNLVWMICVKYRTRELAELEQRDLITAAERRQLEAAYDFLLRVRNQLHYVAARPVDVLSRNYQPEVARAMGYAERSLNQRLQRFMRDFYTHAGAIFRLNRLLERRLALLPHPRLIPSLRGFLRQRRHNAAYVIDGFKAVDGEVHPASDRILVDDPARLMRAFRFAQQRNLRLAPDLEHLIRRKLDLVNAKFRADPHVRETFLAILGERGNVAASLRAMHELGVLGRFLPPFGRLTNHVQHEFYHLYTTDEHTLVCLEKLDQVSGATQPPFKAYAELLSRVERPFILYLALLLHDVGKACSDQDHATEGGNMARSVARRLRLDAAATELLQFLIQNHLLMAMVSQQRDLDDPIEIRTFARQVGTLPRLDLLMLHTFADSMGTSDKLWTGHKDSLLWALYRQTVKRFAVGREADQAEAGHRRQVAEAVAGLVPRTITEPELRAHFDLMPARYFSLRSAPEIAADIELAHTFMGRQLDEAADGLAPVLAWHHDQDRGYSRLEVTTWDREGLFENIAGVLTAARLNILNAEIFTREDSIAQDTFLVTDAATGVPASKAQQENVDRWLAGLLTGRLQLEQVLAENRPARSVFAPAAAGSIPTRVRFDNSTHEDRTVIAVETEDRVGLLHTLVRTITGLGLTIQVAKIATDRGAAIDTFYLTEAGGGPIVSPVRLDETERQLKRAVSGL